MYTRTTDDLIRVAAVGGGFHVAAARDVMDLVRIAEAAASTPVARITITRAYSLAIDDLVRIAAAGKGAVTFE